MERTSLSKGRHSAHPAIGDGGREARREFRSLPSSSFSSTVIDNPAKSASELDAAYGGGSNRSQPTPPLNSSQSSAAHPPNGGDAEIDEIDEARASEYMLLAGLLLRAPSQDLLDRIGRIPGDNSPLGRAHAALAMAARATDRDKAGAEFFNLFVGVGRGDVVPYASFYRTGFLHARPLSHVRADMARLGIMRGEAVFEPEDHLGTMLEVMAGLIRRDFEAGAGAAADFFKVHIEPWGERLLQDVALAPAAMFYRVVAEVGKLWIEIETESFALPA